MFGGQKTSLLLYHFTALLHPAHPLGSLDAGEEEFLDPFEPGVDGIADASFVFGEMRAALRDPGTCVDMGMGHDDAVDLVIDAADAQLRGRMRGAGVRATRDPHLIRHPSLQGYRGTGHIAL